MMFEQLTDFGWRPLLEQQLRAMEEPNVRPARVLDVHRSVVHVVAPDLDVSLPTPLNLEDGPLTVGDWVLIDESGQRIVALLDRSSLFRRKAPGTDRREQLIAANVDTLLIVSSCNQESRKS